MTTDLTPDALRRTHRLGTAALATSLTALALLAFVGSSIRGIATTALGWIVAALILLGYVLTLVAALRGGIRHGAAGGALRSYLTIGVALAASALSTLLLVATVTSLALPSAREDHAELEASYLRAEAMRPWILPADPTIDPAEAGEAVARLSVRPVSAPGRLLSLRPIVPHGATPWPGEFGTPLAPTLFPNHRVSGSVLSPALIDSLPRTLSAAERDFLRAVAEAPHWAEVALVARAPHVDLLAGRVMLPLSDSVTIFDLPFLPNGGIRGVTQANAARIAYHLERGDREAARTAAAEMLSFGLRLLDGSRNIVTALIGMTTVALAREQYLRTLRVLGDPEAERMAAAIQQAEAAVAARPATPRTIQAWVRAPNPAPLRWEMLALVGVLPCTDTRTLLFGPDAETREAFALVRSELARTASDTAMIASAEFAPERRTALGVGLHGEFLQHVTAFVGSAIGNPRMAGCVTGFI